MESTLLHPAGLGHPLPRPAGKLVAGLWRCSSRHLRAITAVVAEPRGGGLATGPKRPAVEEKTVYNDKWFDRLAIHHLSRSIQATTGIRNEKEGYDGLIEAAAAVARNFDVDDQQVLVTESLKKAFPKSILDMIRVLTPPSKFTREFFAVFTTIFFPWLIGKCEVRESEFEGKREKNVVYMPKCRFLEGTNCAGMCTNLCKVPSQKFIKDSLGMSMYMVPNFEDMSCEMIFGQDPPKDDPALNQPCYKKLCIAKQTHGVDCSS